MLSSARFANLALFIKKNKSLIKLLNKIGPKMETCGTTDNRISKMLSAPFNLAPYCLSFKYEYENVKASVVNLYAWSFAISKSWGM